MATDTNIVRLVKFSELNKWDCKRYITSNVRSKYTLTKIGKHIICQTEKIKPFDNPNKDYCILGVSNTDGMFDAYIEKGCNIKQPYKIVKNGYIAYNPYRVNVGSVGLKTNNQKYDLISPAYVVFSCKDTLLPEFIHLLMKTQSFNRLIRDNTTGSVRQTLSFDSLKEIRIPLPSIAEQQALLDAYNANLQKAVNAAIECQKTKDSIDNYLLDSLGIQINPIKTNSNKLIFVSRLRDISRWDMWTQKSEYVTTNYRFSKFGSIVLGKPLYGANEKAVKEKSDVRYLRITDINEDGTLGDEFVSANRVEEKYLLENNDFLIACSGNTVGKTFLYKSEIGKCIFAGYLVRYKLNETKILPDYLLEYTKSSIFKSWISNNQRIFGQPNINGQEYLNADIIVPPLETQKEIAKNIEAMRLKIKALRKEAESLRQRAKKEFEEAVFGEN